MGTPAKVIYDENQDETTIHFDAGGGSVGAGLIMVKQGSESILINDYQWAEIKEAIDCYQRSKKGMVELGPFVSVPYCKSCGYFWRPYPGFIHSQSSICRSCGGHSKSTIGRYKKLITKKWFSKKIEIIGFIPKS